MLGSRPVATLTGHAGIQEWGHLVTILGSFYRSLDAADMAVEAAGEGGQVHRRFPSIGIGRSHVPHLPLPVPVHRRLEKEAILRKQVGSSKITLADVVQQLAAAPHRRVTG